MKKNSFNENLPWLGMILQYIKEYGIYNIIKAIFILLVLRILFNPTIIFDKYTEYISEKHTRELINRNNDDQKIKSLLPILLSKSGASRVWIIQYHNGISDWQYGSMRFELPKENVYSIKEQYNNFHLSWLNLPDYLKIHKVFIGNLEDLKKLDYMLYDRFRKNKINYLACILLWDEDNNPTGILGFTWESEQQVFYDETFIKENLIRYGAIVGQYIKLNRVANIK